jgi:hypothetical protein
MPCHTAQHGEEGGSKGATLEAVAQEEACLDHMALVASASRMAAGSDLR